MGDRSSVIGSLQVVMSHFPHLEGWMGLVGGHRVTEAGWLGMPVLALSLLFSGN